MKKFLTIDNKLYINAELVKFTPNCLRTEIGTLGTAIPLADLINYQTSLLVDKITYYAEEDEEEAKYVVFIFPKIVMVSFDELSTLHELFVNVPAINVGYYDESVEVVLEFVFKNEPIIIDYPPEEINEGFEEELRMRQLID